eukprot:tig00000402_g184.t1
MAAAAESVSGRHTGVSGRHTVKVSVSHTVEISSSTQLVIDDDRDFARRKGLSFGIRFADPQVESSYQEDSLNFLQQRYRQISLLLVLAAVSSLVYHTALAGDDTRVRVAWSCAALCGVGIVNTMLLRVRRLRQHQQKILAAVCLFFFLWSQYFFCGIFRQPMTHAIDMGLMGLVMASQVRILRSTF